MGSLVSEVCGIAARNLELDKNMKLSILICHLPHRNMEELMNVLTNQLTPECEIKIDNRVGVSTGTKRNDLLKEAIGKYVVYIDDDDQVPEYYVSEMLQACASDADCFAINGIMTTDGQHETKWYLSKDFKNEDKIEGNKTVYYRHTNHITGVKREIALAAGFPDKSNAEDKHYSDRLVLRTEYKIESPMYHYRFSSHNKSYK